MLDEGINLFLMARVFWGTGAEKQSCFVLYERKVAGLVFKENRSLTGFARKLWDVLGRFKLHRKCTGVYLSVLLPDVRDLWGKI